jgi:hypothetical protein
MGDLEIAYIPWWAHREPAPHGELLIDCEEDRVLRAVLVGMLREAGRNA